MNLYEAIFLRKSVRSYEMEPVSSELLQELRDFYEQIEGLNPGIRLKFPFLTIQRDRIRESIFWE